MELKLWSFFDLRISKGVCLNLKISKYLVCCSFTILFLLSGCSTSHTERPKTESNVTKEKFLISLYITKEGNVDPLNVNITIDHDTVINQDFSDPLKSQVDTLKMGKLSFSRESSPTNWQFKLKLTEGDHRLIATSSNGHARLDSVFTVDKMKWIVLRYGPDKMFRLQISDTPVGFE